MSPFTFFDSLRSYKRSTYQLKDMRLGIFLKLMGESIRFAIQVLTTNLLRTTLSLLGVTIGIMLIISVFTMVDSLEKNIKDSLDFLGSNVVTVDKFPFGTGPDPNYPWWK